MQVSKDYLLRTIAGETILIPSGAAAQKFNGLVTVNAIGAFIWDVLQAPTDLDALVARITDEYDVDADTARRETGVAPGMKVCDMCAAPGGKTMYLADLMEHRGELVAWELHPHRTELLRKNLERMDVRIAKTECRDSCVYDKNYEEYFDVVVLDAPCSGLGVIGRKPELKWQNPDEIKELLPVQKSLLQNAGFYVKPGGILFYSTCTLNKAENEGMVLEFLESHPEFVLDETVGMKNLLPHRDGMGGFFMARMKKSGAKQNG